jgi:copper chaperone CopZ
MKTHQLKIEGMSCDHCVMHVKKELSTVAGLVVDDVQIGKATVRYEENAVSEEKISQAVEDAGYKLVANTLG